MRPSILQGELRFRFFGRTDEVTTKEVFAIYHGRFIEAMMAHFDTKEFHDCYSNSARGPRRHRHDEGGVTSIKAGRLAIELGGFICDPEGVTTNKFHRYAIDYF